MHEQECVPGQRDLVPVGVEQRLRRDVAVRDLVAGRRAVAEALELEGDPVETPDHPGGRVDEERDRPLTRGRQRCRGAVEPGAGRIGGRGRHRGRRRGGRRDWSAPPLLHAAASHATPSARAARRMAAGYGVGSVGGDRYAWPAMASLAERLGYAADAKLLIVTCDDLGFTASANVAVYEALRDGCRHQRVADGPVRVGPRRRRPLPRRGRRRAASPSTPSTRRTGGARSPTRPASSTATAASRARSRTPGTTPTSTRSVASAGRRSSGRSSGAST